MSLDESGMARPPGAPKRRPQRKKLPHERPLWLRPEDEIFFITVCCEPRGKNQLCDPKIARAIFDSVEFRNQNHVWYARFVCLMPDHLHALISFPYERPMKQSMADWKRFLATQLEEWSYFWTTDPQENTGSEHQALAPARPAVAPYQCSSQSHCSSPPV